MNVKSDSDLSCLHFNARSNKNCQKIKDFIDDLKLSLHGTACILMTCLIYA